MSDEEKKLQDEESKRVWALLDELCDWTAPGEMDAKFQELDACLAEREGTEQTAACDAEKSLAAFKKKHEALFAGRVVPITKRKGRKRRIFLTVAAVAVFGALGVTAIGTDPFHMLPQWGEQTFRFRSDFKTDKIGNVIYEDRSGMDSGKSTDTGIQYEPPEDRDSTPEPAETPQTPENSALEQGLEQFADPSELGIEKGKSRLDSSGTMETYRVMNMTAGETALAYGIEDKIFPNWVPDGFEQDYVEVTLDGFLGSVDIMVNYLNGDKEFAVSTMTLMEGQSGSCVEKDERPVIRHTAGGVDYYIMHNLERVNADVIIGNREVIFWGDVTVDEMRKIIDSVYEGE